MHRPLRLVSDEAALKANFRALQASSGTVCGAAIKADGYGLGAREVMSRLYDVGCRDFFVSTWWEAEQLGQLPAGTSIVVLHGFTPDDEAACLRSAARPVLNTPEQIARWKEVAGQRLCDVMIDTGMNRLGLRSEEAYLLEGLNIDTLHSHLACADMDHPLTAKQLRLFRSAAGEISARRFSLANSAGIFLGRDYSFDLVRPGLALYGGIPRPDARAVIRQVAFPEAQVVQRRTVRAGESCGYEATFVAQRDTKVAIVNIGYADGYWRGFSSRGSGEAACTKMPVVGRVSMDLVAIDCSNIPEIAEGDWVKLDFELETAARQSGKSQYELLTGLGNRFERIWR